MLCVREREGECWMRVGDGFDGDGVQMVSYLSFQTTTCGQSGTCRSRIALGTNSIKHISQVNLCM